MIFGIKVSYDDAERIMGSIRNFEIQMIEKDMNRLDKLKKKFSSINANFVIHPPFVIDDKPPDMASSDEKHRRASINQMKKITELADAINAKYVITHPGGMGPVEMKNKACLEKNLAKSLEELDSEKIILENMMWFYRHEGNAFYSNLLIKPDEFENYSNYAAGICLDVCHAFLATNPGSTKNITEFIGRLGSKIKHLHMADAKSPDKHGLQIDEGGIDFSLVLKKLKNIDAMAVPEIADGHKNNGMAFYEAIRRMKMLTER